MGTDSVATGNQEKQSFGNCSKSSKGGHGLRSHQEDLPGNFVLARTSKSLHNSIFQKLTLEKLHLLKLGLSFYLVEISILHQIPPGEQTQQ